MTSIQKAPVRRNDELHLPDWRALQTHHIRHRYRVSEHHARAVAELAFANGGDL